MMGIYWDLFFVFFKIGLFSFGGGLAMVSVIQQEVLAHGWIPAAEYARIITISQMDPAALTITGAMGRGYLSTALPAAPMDYGMEAPIRAGGVFGSIMQTAIPAAD